MKKNSKLLSLALSGMMLLSLSACGSSAVAPTASATTAATETTDAATESKAEESKDGESKAVETTTGAETTAKAADNTGKTYKIGVIQFVQHNALDAANKGFFAALDDAGISYKADQQNASGIQSTCQTIADKLVSDGDDLILAIATPAAQAIAGATSEVPILLTAVTDPADSGLVNDNKNPGVNVSGTSDLAPVVKQIDLLKQLLPEAKTVGILYCSAEANSVFQARMAREAIEKAGMTAEDYTVSNSNEIQIVVQSMVGKVDAIYAPTDNLIAAGMDTVSMVANDNKLPIICGEKGMVEAGGLATYGIDYYQLGYVTGQQAVEILTNGADIKTMPIGYLPDDKCELTINEETAKLLGIDVSGLK